MSTYSSTTSPGKDDGRPGLRLRPPQPWRHRRWRSCSPINPTRTTPRRQMETLLVTAVFGPTFQTGTLPRPRQTSASPARTSTRRASSARPLWALSRARQDGPQIASGASRHLPGGVQRPDGRRPSRAPQWPREGSSPRDRAARPRACLRDDGPRCLSHASRKAQPDRPMATRRSPSIRCSASPWLPSRRPRRSFSRRAGSGRGRHGSRRLGMRSTGSRRWSSHRRRPPCL